MTTGVSLVRENAESMQPPRTLWVSFPLGRPLGKPGDAKFQHQVIGASLELLTRGAGPLLEDFPLDVPGLNPESVSACPVSFAQPDTSARLTADLAAVMPWYDLGRRRRERSLVGVSDCSPQENIVAIGQLLDQGRLPLDSLPWFKHAVEDLKVLYLEALTARPGDYNQQRIHQIFWQESVLGAGLIQLYHGFMQSENPSIAMVARIIVPRDAVGESTSEIIFQRAAGENN